MHSVIRVSILSLFALSATAAPTDGMPTKRAASSTCPSYTIINTRGTGEAQGESSAFRTMNSQITSQLSGGKIYNTVYSASYSQDSTAATQDIINKISTTLKSSPNECFVLQGYSQGAAATVNALSSLTDASFDAVKGVFLVGDPEHKSGLACNIDNNGGTTTKDVNGLEIALSKGIPDNWISKTSDVCIYGDGVCDTTHGTGITAQHLSYPTDSSTQKLGASFAVAKLGDSS
ncbi:A cutinase-like protein from cryptococcus Sp [Xylaria venustula]|nr:A cutinase-like protein from cryptococcus Sp [Xylaria venustula]